MLDIEMSKTGDSHPSENSANGIEEVTGCCARAESTRKASLAASRFNCENLFHGVGCAFVNLDSVPWAGPHGSEVRLILDIKTSKTSDSHPSKHYANRITEVTG